MSLLGPGMYMLCFDNSYSLITSKEVYVDATLRWSGVRIERHEVTTHSYALMAGGLALAIAGTALHVVGGRIAPNPENVDAVLLDLAGRTTPVAGGPQETALLKLKTKGIDSNEVSKLINVIAKARGVHVEASKPLLGPPTR